MTYEFEWNVFASLGHLVAGAAASVAVLLLVLHLECTLNVGCRHGLTLEIQRVMMPNA